MPRKIYWLDPTIGSQTCQVIYIDCHLLPQASSFYESLCNPDKANYH